jgi:hypothetical protein
VPFYLTTIQGYLERLPKAVSTAAVVTFLSQYFLSSLARLSQALTSGGAIWLDYVKLFDESRLVHVTSLDFATLTTLAPFWMYNDAQGRNWEQRWVPTEQDCVTFWQCVTSATAPCVHVWGRG